MNTSSCARTAPVCLRPYQMNAIARVAERAAGGVRRILIVAPTGAGKTSIAVAIIVDALARGLRVVFLAHRRELIAQAYARLVQMGVPEHDVGVLMAGDSRWRPGARVQIASIDTLRNRPKPLADVIFTDECHRALTKSHETIAAHYAHALHLGLTATPYRADGKGLGKAYDEMVVVATPRQLIAEGFLVEPRVYTVPVDQLPDVSSVRVRGNDYDERELAAAVNTKGLVGNIVEHWKQLAAGLRTIAFAASVEHSQHIAATFRAAGISAEHLDGTTPIADREATLARVRRGETLLLSNVGLFGEGLDLPMLKCAILARPTKSMGLYLQQAGRVMRPYEGQAAIILDHAGCAVEHGLPQDDREFTLDNAKKREGKGAAPVRACSACLEIVPASTRVCPCGHVLIEASSAVEVQDGKLVEMRTDDRKRRELARLRLIALQRGYKPGWVYHRYKDKFGEPPPDGVISRSATLDEQALTQILEKGARDRSFTWSLVDAAWLRPEASR